MEILEGLLFINDTDVYLQYGAFLTEDSPGSFSNYSELLKPAKMKPYTAVDFREEDGEKLPDVLPDPAYEPRDVTLYFAILANTAAVFLSRYSAFLGLLKSGWLNIRLPELNKTYRMYYRESSAYDQLTPIDGKVAAKFKVIFREPVPEN
ncbi:hypothetical protein M2138_001728 [Dysgonomonadaceae bacterium PH5-43]|nr:hypothetical protein [Dysgonomonadaceae bacterium PH5-43]